MVSDAELEIINAKRRALGRPPLTRDQINRSHAEAGSPSYDSGFDATGFLIGYMTGMPWPSAGGIMGAMLHPSSSPSYAADAPASTPEPSYSAPNAPDPSPSYDSGSSSSYDSGSSSSSDSGGGSSGGSD